jgi:hypothetical protein
MPVTLAGCLSVLVTPPKQAPLNHTVNREYFTMKKQKQIPYLTSFLTSWKGQINSSLDQTGGTTGVAHNRLRIRQRTFEWLLGMQHRVPSLPGRPVRRKGLLRELCDGVMG